MVLELLSLVATQSPDVGAVLSENGLYGVITILGLTTAGGWGLATKLMLARGTDVLKAERQLHADYKVVIKDMRDEFRAEYKDQHEKNATAWENTAKGVTELRFSVERLINQNNGG